MPGIFGDIIKVRRHNEADPVWSHSRRQEKVGNVHPTENFAIKMILFQKTKEDQRFTGITIKISIKSKFPLRFWFKTFTFPKDFQKFFEFLFQKSKILPGRFLFCLIKNNAALQGFQFFSGKMLIISGLGSE